MKRPLVLLHEHICMRCGFIIAVLASVKMTEVQCPMCKLPTEWTDWPSYVKAKAERKE